MARDPKARIGFLSYKGGSMAAPQGLLEHLFGGTHQWTDPRLPGSTPGGRRRRAYGSKQRTLARSGLIGFLELKDGSVWSFRYKGAMMDFIAELLKESGDKVVRVWTQRGSEYMKQFLKQ